MGSWVTYGLGTENENLPGFVVLISSGVQPSGGPSLWGSGFLPSVFQGVQCRSKGDPILFVSDPPGMDRQMRRRTLDTLRAMNETQARELGHPETATRIAQYELAYRMQTSVPELIDVSREPKHVQGWRQISVWEEVHPYMKHWWVPGCAIGYEHTFGNQAADLMSAVALNKPMQPNFDDGLKCQLVLDAVMEACASDRWVRVKQMTRTEAI